MAGRRQSAVRPRGTFDAFDLVRRQAALAGTADVATMPRAADRLVEETGRASTVVSWRITGTVDYEVLAAIEEKVQVRLFYYPRPGVVRCIGIFHVRAALAEKAGKVTFDMPEVSSRQANVR